MTAPYTCEIPAVRCEEGFPPPGKVAIPPFHSSARCAGQVHRGDASPLVIQGARISFYPLFAACSPPPPPFAQFIHNPSSLPLGIVLPPCLHSPPPLLHNRAHPPPPLHCSIKTPLPPQAL